MPPREPREGPVPLRRIPSHRIRTRARTHRRLAARTVAPAFRRLADNRPRASRASNASNPRGLRSRPGTGPIGALRSPAGGSLWTVFFAPVLFDEASVVSLFSGGLGRGSHLPTLVVRRRRMSRLEVRSGRFGPSIRHELFPTDNLSSVFSRTMASTMRRTASSKSRGEVTHGLRTMPPSPLSPFAGRRAACPWPFCSGLSSRSGNPRSRDTCGHGCTPSTHRDLAGA
jgi:hypothetical protein